MYKIFIAIFLACFTTAIFATEKPIIIPEIRLSIKKMGIKRQDNATQTIHITRKQIADSQAVNLYELLQQQQSIARLANNSGISNQTTLSIRGFGDNAAANTLILVDGFPLSNPSLLAPNLRFITKHDIERIDILQGSQGTLWGDQAVGGVINIISRHLQKRTAVINLGLGNLNQQLLSSFIANSFSNGVFFKGYAITYQTDNYRHHNQQEDRALSAQAGVDYARGILRLTFERYDNNIAIPNSLTQPQYDTDTRQASGLLNYIDYKTHAFQLLNKHELADNWLLETRLAMRDLSGIGFIYSLVQRNERQTDFRPRLMGHWGSNKIILGYDFQGSVYRVENSFADEKVTAVQQDLYLQTMIPIGPVLEFTLGGRVAWQHSRIRQGIQADSNPHARVWVSEQGLNFHPHSEWRFFLRRDGSFSFAKANQQTWLPASVGRLLPQTGVSYEAGASWKKARHTTQISVYQLDLNNEIAYDLTATPGSPFGSYRNFFKTKRRGITLAERYQMTSQLDIDLQLDYVKALFVQGNFSGKFIPAVPTFNANIGLNYQISPHWQTQYNAVYTGSRYASEDNANIGAQLSGYWLSSIGVQYAIRGFRAGINVSNLFNQRYPTYTLFNPINKSNSYYPGAGRAFLLTLGVEV